MKSCATQVWKILGVSVQLSGGDRYFSKEEDIFDDFESMENQKFKPQIIFKAKKLFEINCGSNYIKINNLKKIVQISAFAYPYLVALMYNQFSIYDQSWKKESLITMVRILGAMKTTN